MRPQLDERGQDRRVAPFLLRLEFVLKLAIWLGFTFSLGLAMFYPEYIRRYWQLLVFVILLPFKLGGPAS